MSSDVLERQQFVVRLLESQAQRSRIAHTYLFTGKEEDGLEEIALAFACRLNDEAGLPMGDYSSPSSKKILNGNHPDVMLLGRDETASSLKIEEVRNLIRDVSLKPFEGNYKVAILIGAERLTTEAQNAFLKTLEEPPAQTVFCLLVSKKENLLETIQSRSFEVKFAPSDAGAEIFQGLEGVGSKSWEELFEDQQGLSRIELKDWLGKLLQHFREQMYRSATEKRSEELIPVWLKAVDLICETQDAVSSNVNQKIALTRLAVHFKKLMPARDYVTV